MEENKFEKHIRRELEGMKIIPPDKAWANVEKRIGRKKDRRPLTLLLIFLVLGIATGGYLFLKPGDGHNHRLVASQTDTIQKQDSRLTRQNVSTAKTQPVPPSGSRQRTAANQVNSPEDQSQRNYEKLSTPDLHSDGLKYSYSNGENTPLEKYKKNEPAIIATPEIHSAATAPGINELQKPVVADVQKESKTTPAHTLVSKKKDSPGIPVRDITALTTGNTQKEPAAGKKKDRWIWGLNFSAGSSYTGNSLFGLFDQNKNLAVYYQNDPGTGYGQQPIPAPSLPQHSFAFTGGIAATKAISLKSKLSLGLGYKYFSTTNMVGGLVSNSLEWYYSNTGSQKIYQNHFHFIEVPVDLKIRLTKNNRLPVYWKAGIHISQLIASNALQFEGGRYFTDNSMFNKTQLGFSTGVVVTLFSNQKLPVNIGPEAYYGATKIANEGLYGNTHFVFPGLRAEILLQRKK